MFSYISFQFFSSVFNFSIDFIASAPESYNHLTGGGAYDNRTIGVGKNVLESLQSGDFSCGNIVTFFALVTVDDTPTADNYEPQTKPDRKETRLLYINQ